MMKNYIKYPRTYHLPWSPCVGHDDVRMVDTRHFLGQDVIVTEKMDGENTTLYHDHMHARSLDSRHHPSRNWVKQWHATFAHEIPHGFRICGENLYAQHSVIYTDLTSYFYGFSIWNKGNTCLSWAETQAWFDLFGSHVPNVLYQGIWDEAAISNLRIDESRVEGYVVRLANAFAYDRFACSVAKWVRPNHVQTDQHWIQSELVPNTLQSTTLKECTNDEAFTEQEATQQDTESEDHTKPQPPLEAGSWK